MVSRFFNHCEPSPSTADYSHLPLLVLAAAVAAWRCRRLTCWAGRQMAAGGGRWRRVPVGRWAGWLQGRAQAGQIGR